MEMPTCIWGSKPFASCLWIYKFLTSSLLSTLTASTMKRSLTESWLSLITYQFVHDWKRAERETHGKEGVVRALQEQ